MTWKKLLLPAVLCAASFCHLTAGDFALVKDGKAANIVIGEHFANGAYKCTKFGEGESRAALELADYAEKVTGVRPTISLKAMKDRPNIYLFVWFWASNPPAKVEIPAELNKLKDDGFYLYANDDTAYVIGRRPRAVMYGAYEILKKYGDVRWLIPGEEGESILKKDSIIIPEQHRVFNPSIAGRNFNLVCAHSGSTYETPKWMMRNNMTSWFVDHDQSWGGHIFSTLLPDTLFPEHPELYGLYNGKRMPQCGVIQDDPKKYGTGGQANQPCTSNPETKKIMLQNLLLNLGRYRADHFGLTNNDSTAWCQCENCKKLDPPEEVKRGMVSTRFWDLANYLVTETRKVYPNMKFTMSAYQDYQEPPEHLKPVPGVSLDLCVHHRCYLHDINDPKCDLNVRYRELIKRWSALGTTVSTYEYTDMMPRGTVCYLPLEGVMARDMKYYASMHNSGYCDEAPPWDGTFGKEDGRRVLEDWKANALVRYVQAAFMWDANQNLDDVIEDFGSRYYGKAWPVMKQYRTLLRNAYESTDSHFLYGTPPMALGRCVADQKVFDELNSLLAQAVKAAEGDAVVSKRVKEEKEYFELSFGELRQKYLDQQQAPCEANHVTGKIVIDGDFSEADWQKAVPIDDFRIFGGKGLPASQKTEVRALWDENNLYLAVKAYGKNRPEIKPEDKPTYDAPDFWSNSKYPGIEFFFTSPTWGYQYLQWVVNSNGSVWDAKTLTPMDSQIAYNANAEVRTKNTPEGWQAEIRMPFSSLGNLVPKQGMKLRVNIARSLTTNGQWEGTSWSYGAFHGSDGYREILFR